MTLLAAGDSGAAVRSLLAVPGAAEVPGLRPLARGLALNVVRLHPEWTPEETP